MNENLLATYSKAYFVFLAFRGKDYRSAVAIDDVMLQEGECEPFPRPPPITTPAPKEGEITKFIPVPTATNAVVTKKPGVLSKTPFFLEHTGLLYKIV